jgi:broad specificity phosphatase PhoE
VAAHGHVFPKGLSMSITALRGFVVLAAICAIGWPAVSFGQASSSDLPVVIVIRHADRTPAPADDLIPAGHERARDLVATLQNAGVTAIIHTDQQRSRDTAAPLAAKLGLRPEVFPLPAREQTEQRVQHIKALDAAIRRHAGGVVLVVGHEPTVPAIIASLGGPQLPDVCATVFDNLFVLVPSRDKPKLIRGRYGAPTDGGPECH